jgi:hypothetical protein
MENLLIPVGILAYIILYAFLRRQVGQFLARALTLIIFAVVVGTLRSFF